MRRALLSAASCCPAPPAVATGRAACSCFATAAAVTTRLLLLHGPAAPALLRLLLMPHCPNSAAKPAGGSCAASAARFRASWPRAPSMPACAFPCCEAQQARQGRRAAHSNKAIWLNGTKALRLRSKSAVDVRARHCCFPRAAASTLAHMLPLLKPPAGDSRIDLSCRGTCRRFQGMGGAQRGVGLWVGFGGSSNGNRGDRPGNAVPGACSARATCRCLHCLHCLPGRQACETSAVRRQHGAGEQEGDMEEKQR